MKKVMVVDDDSMTRDLISFTLRQKGFEVITVDDGLHAVMQAQDEPPDLLILDVMLPDFSGLEVLNLLKSRFKVDVPVIIMSRIDHQKVMIAADKLGVIEYLVKPFEMVQLTDKINSLPGFESSAY